MIPIGATLGSLDTDLRYRKQDANGAMNDEETAAVFIDGSTNDKGAPGWGAFVVVLQFGAVVQRLKSSGLTASESGGNVAGSAPKARFGVAPIVTSSVPPLAMSA